MLSSSFGTPNTDISKKTLAAQFGNDFNQPSSKDHFLQILISASPLNTSMVSFILHSNFTHSATFSR